MMYPGVDEALDAIVETVENEIAPHVQDELAASLCRTVAQMLRSVRVRVEHEPAALLADNQTLRGLLTEWLDELPDESRTTAAAAIAKSPAPVYPSLADLKADATRLRSALVDGIQTVEDADHGFRMGVREYLTQQLGHEKAWMQDAFTGPRR
jgi:hypothetical protein